MEDLGAAGHGLAGVVYDGVGVVLDGAREVVLAADLHGLVDGRSQPRHREGDDRKDEGFKKGRGGKERRSARAEDDERWRRV